MTATIPQLVFSALFCIAVNAGTLFVMLPQEQGLRIIRTVVVWMSRVIVRSVPSRHHRQIASIPLRVVVPIRRRRAVRVYLEAVSDHAASTM